MRKQIIMKQTKRIQPLLLFLVLVSLLSACSGRSKAEYKTDREDRDETLNYVVYEGIFLDRDEILSIAEDIREASLRIKKQSVSFI